MFDHVWDGLKMKQAWSNFWRLILDHDHFIFEHVNWFLNTKTSEKFIWLRGQKFFSVMEDEASVMEHEASAGPWFKEYPT